MRPLYFLALLILGTSCTNPQDQPQLQTEGQQNYLLGIASPIKLNPERTFINLEDYFIDINLIDAANLDGVELAIDRKNRGVEVVGGIESVIGNLEVIVQGQSYDIPVLASKKILYTLEYPGSPNAESICVAGNINGWNPKADSMKLVDGIWKLEKWLSPGLYQYQIVKDGDWMLDDQNPNSMSNGQGGFNSTFQVGDPEAKKAFIWPSEENSAGVFISEEGKSMNAVLHVYWNNQLITSQVDNGDWLVNIPEEAKNHERSHLRAWLSNENGLSNDILIPLAKGKVVNDPRQLSRHDRQGNVMYFIMIDRFADGNPENTLPVDDPSILPVANHYGGDFEGISAKIKEGYF